MNREIKFRAKSINEDEWITSMTIANGTIKRKQHDYFFEVSDNRWKGVNAETIGQYTGLKDCNGKEIYEGDIILFNTTEANSKPIGVIRYNELTASFMFKDIELVNVFESGFCQPSNSKSLEVVGNVYENPELLAKNIEVNYEQIK